MYRTSPDMQKTTALNTKDFTKNYLPKKSQIATTILANLQTYQNITILLFKIDKQMSKLPKNTYK